MLIKNIIKALYAMSLLLPKGWALLHNYIYLKLSNTYWKAYPTIAGKLTRRGKGLLTIGHSVRINSSMEAVPVGMSLKTLFYVDAGAQIKLGDGVGISNTLFYASQSITVEDNVLIGGGCQILDNDFHSISYEDRMLKGDKNVKQLPILIKKGAFIGTCSIILKGVTIGERSIIAAGSVVTKSVPADQIWGGNPAQFIRNLTVH